MATFGGPADWWTDGTDAGRKHIATKGIVQNGLVLNLDAGVSDSHSGTGTTWSDLSGNGNNGTLTNMSATPLDSGNGGSLVFDGVNDYISLSTVTLNRANSTVSSWLNISDFSTGKTSTGRVWIRNTSSNSNQLVAFYNGGYSFEVSTNSNPHEINNRTSGNVSSSDISANNWFHFCLVFLSNTFYGYVNGNYTGTGALSSDSSFNRIGDATSYSSGYPGYFKGKIANFRYYSRGLSANEVFQNFNATRGRFGI